MQMQTMSLTNEEIAHRVAILKRLRGLLEEQRNKFKEYLQVLESQENSILKEDSEAILHHVELEESILTEINTIQKVIDPMEHLYKTVHTNTDETTIPHLKTDLAKLQNQVLARNKKNRDLLKEHLVDLRTKIASMQRPRYNTGVYTDSANIGNVINIVS
ncbi:flagellar biosynthesis protein FlgN [Treponema phagedenis]|uniref:flagellar biosynthesis protein FlgN n=1 Tax=Treponema phagedenis TaxID=162 RepID=UPI0011EEA4CF|nr:flagellar biosynthesis protein FlgN [Treponema phagedenis]TYT76545.1 flagellar biosynthesis protein FlgN [Treponema phagedenis]TYT77717.1 flagellar biosynthesis protein FlgN [Treponema phagedenis]